MRTHIALTTAALIALVTMIGLARPASANLVSNAGFETGDFTGWTNGGNLGFTGVDGNPHSGTAAAYFGPVGSDGTLSQALATSTGGVYDLTFWLYNDSGPTNDFSAWWDGASVASFVDAGPFAYTEFSIPGLVASSPSTPLEFRFRQDPGFLYFDDVSVVPHGTVTPEPTTLAFLALGGLALVRRRRR